MKSQAHKGKKANILLVIRESQSKDRMQKLKILLRSSAPEVFSHKLLFSLVVLLYISFGNAEFGFPSLDVPGNSSSHRWNWKVYSELKAL